MARFRCSACAQEGEFDYDPKRHECPNCGSTNVQFALGVEELPEEFVEALLSAEPLDEHKDED
jgi:primosomal protein N'